MQLPEPEEKQPRPIRVITLAQAYAEYGAEYVERRQAEHEALVARVKPTP